MPRGLLSIGADTDQPLVKVEDAEVDEDRKPSPSFTGRLNLAQYAFSPQSSSSEGVTVNTKATSTAPVQPRRSLRRTSAEASLVQILQSPKRRVSIGSRTSSRSREASPRKKARYAPPSTYAHLPPLRDVLAKDLICLFVGLNPGIETARSGHAYAHPSNLFWKLLHSSGCTPLRLRPEEDGTLPARFALGNTNIVSRPTRNGAELSKAEMDDSVQALEDKIKEWKPLSVCLVGKGIWESVFRVRHRRAIRKDEFHYGWQDERENMGRVPAGEASDGWNGARLFVATSTSGLAASLLPAEKERIWRELGVWVEEKRIARGLTGDAAATGSDSDHPQK